MSARSTDTASDKAVRQVQLDGLVVLKIAKHCKEHLPNLVAGQLLGLDVGSTLEVTNCFPFIRVDDEDGDSNSSNNAAAAYQIEMMRCLNEVNVDHATIGWYQSTILGSFLNERMISTQYNYQAALTNSVCLVYDPVKTTQGSLSLKAFRLTDAFMERYKENDFSQDALARSHLTFNDILEEVPISIRNSHLISAFLWELEDSIEHETPAGLDFHRLDLSFQPFLEKNLDFLIEYCDELYAENNKYQAYQRSVQRQQTAIQSFIAKRREPVTEAEIEATFKPIPQPSRLESLLLTQQVAQFTKQINEFSAQNLSKLFVFSELNGEK